MAEILARSAPRAADDRLAPRTHRREWRWPAAAAALAMLALLLRLHRIDNEPLWLDEGYTLLFSGMSLPRLISVGGAHEHPPLYYLLVHALRALHDSFLVPRLVSAAAGALSVFVIYLVGTRLFTRAAGLIAAALLTVVPLQVWYGQDGRGYELAGLFVLLSYWGLLCALDEPQGKTWATYTLFTTAALYTEYTTIFALLPQALFLLKAGWRGLTMRLLMSWLAVALLFAPWVGVVAGDAAGIAADYWIPPPTLSSFSATILEFLGLLTPCPSPPCRGTLLGVPFLAGHEAVVALAVVALIAVALIIAIIRRDLSLIVAVAWLALPFILVLLLAVRRSLYLDRVFLDAGVALYLLIGWTVAGLAPIARQGGSEHFGRAQPRRTSSAVIPAVAAILTLAMIGGASLAQLNVIYAGGVNPDWRTLARDFQGAYRPGQSVIYMPGVLRTLLAAYLPAGWHATRETPVWSRIYLDVPGWQSRYPQPAAPSLQQRVHIEAMLRDVQFTAAARGERDVWLITYNYSGMNDSRRWFTDHGFQLLLSELYGGDTRLELWSRSDPSHLGPPVVPPHFGRGWQHTGAATVGRGLATTRGDAVLARAFPVRAGRAYFVGVDYRGLVPSAKPQITVRTYGRTGRILGVFPRTKWYDWPVTGVWLSQPFGFVAPPRAVRAVLTLHTAWGRGSWRRVAVYEER